MKPYSVNKLSVVAANISQLHAGGAECNITRERRSANHWQCPFVCDELHSGEHRVYVHNPVYTIVSIDCYYVLSTFKVEECLSDFFVSSLGSPVSSIAEFHSVRKVRKFLRISKC